MRKLTLEHVSHCIIDATIEHNGEFHKNNSYVAITFLNHGCAQMFIDLPFEKELKEIDRIKIVFHGIDEKEAIVKFFKAFAKELEDNMWFDHI
jgi:hypothetical protein